MTTWPAWTDPLRHPRLLAFVHRIAHRGPKDVACSVCAYVWHRLEADPEFVADLERGKRAFEEGRTTLYRVVDGDLERMP